MDECEALPPGTGADTVFADMTAAFEALTPEKQAQLEGLRAVCSYAHHNAKAGLLHQSTLSQLISSTLKGDGLRVATWSHRDTAA